MLSSQHGGGGWLGRSPGPVPWHKGLVCSVSWEKGAVLSSQIPGNGWRPQAGRNRQVRSSIGARGEASPAQCPLAASCGSVGGRAGSCVVSPRLGAQISVPDVTESPGCRGRAAPGSDRAVRGVLAAAGAVCGRGGLVAAGPGGGGVGRGPGAAAECCGWSASHCPVPLLALLAWGAATTGKGRPCFLGSRRVPPRQDGVLVSGAGQTTACRGDAGGPGVEQQQGSAGCGGGSAGSLGAGRDGEAAVFALAARLCLHTDTFAPGPGTEPAAKLFQR